MLFKNPVDLHRRYDAWLRYALADVSSADVLHFLGRKVTAAGNVHGQYADEVLSDLGQHVDGVRIKHRAGENSIRMYDKAQGRVLRVETTVNDPSDFKVFRTKENEPEGDKDWRVLHAGVADAHRRVEVSQAANEQYLEKLGRGQSCPTACGTAQTVGPTRHGTRDRRSEVACLGAAGRP